jgi:hypothetical protein
VYGAQPGDGQRAADNLLTNGVAGNWLSNPVTVCFDHKESDPVTMCLTKPTAGATDFTVTVTGQAPSLIWLPLRITATAHGTLEISTPTPTISVSAAPPGPPAP